MLIEKMGYTRELSDETKRKISASNQNKVRSAETKAKIAKAKQGTQHSEETKAKISAAISQLWSKVPKTDKDENSSDKPLGF